MNLEEFSERMRPANEAFMRKVADNILKPNYLAEYLDRNNIPRKRPSWVAVRRRRLASWIGQRLLKAANALGEYNDYE